MNYLMEILSRFLGGVGLVVAISVATGHGADMNWAACGLGGVSAVLFGLRKSDFK